MRKLYRSRRDKKLTGLVGGLSEMMNIDATLLRILLVVVTIFSSGTIIFIYIIAAMVVPKEPPYHDFNHNGFGGYGPGPGPGPGPGYGSHYGADHGQSTNFGGYKSFSKQHWNAGHDQSTSSSPQFDSMMDDLEKKALRREIEQLKSKISKYEKGDN